SCRHSPRCQLVPDGFFDADNWQDEEAESHGFEQFHGREGCGIEHGVHEREINEPGLEYEQRSDTQVDVLVGEQADAEYGIMEGSAVQKIENLEEDYRGDGHGLRDGVGVGIGCRGSIFRTLQAVVVLIE